MVESNVGKMTLEEAKEKFTLIQVHAPHLGDDMCPFFELINMPCPKGNNGKCSNCKSFRGIITDNVMVWADMSFEGFCDPN
jgi:hypothetical protein